MIEKEVQELKQQLTQCRHRPLCDDPGNTKMPFPERKLVGEDFEYNAQKIKEWLKDSQATKIGVWGMGGVGKTALVTHVYNMLLQDTSICRSFWVPMSQCENVYKVQGSIAKHIGLNLFEEEDEKIRASKLYSKLANMGNIVLILDDMWESFPAHEVGIPFRENGCKIILTTRLLEVCRIMGCREFVIKVECLPEGEDWELFENILGISYGAMVKEIAAVALLVVEHCHGLPLAIITIACRMIGVVDHIEWGNIWNELEIFNQRDMKDKVFQKLQFSYDQLDDEMAQQCFLSSVIYFEEIGIIHDAERRELIECWIQEGLLDETRGNNEQQQKGQAILNKLVNSCLLLENEGYVRIHNMIRNMAVHLTKDTFMLKWSLELNKVPEDELWGRDLVSVSLGRNIKEIPCDLSPNCPKLRRLDLSRNPLVRISESFFVHMKALKVLDLSDTVIERLPTSVSGLKDLRMLLLRGCQKLMYVPSLAKLSKLKVLELDFCGTATSIKEAGLESLKSLEKFNFECKMSNLTQFNKLVESWSLLSTTVVLL